VKAGFQATLSVFIADRFSNFNVLSGTQVSFFTEAGAVDTSASLDASGFATVTFRTQDPMPVDTPDSIGALGTPNPADGHVTVIAVVRGEEGFVDVNANGVFDPGVDTFTGAMDLGEPFIDANDNDVWDGPGCTQIGCDPTALGEFFVDTNANGVYDGPNGVWDGPGCTQAGCNPSPYVWRALRLQFTGNIVNCSIAPTSISVADGSFQTFTFSVSDINRNAPVPGTTVTISTTAGALQGQTNFTVQDGISTGPFTGTFRLADAATADPVQAGAVTMKVTAPASEVVPCVDTVIFGNLN